MSRSTLIAAALLAAGAAARAAGNEQLSAAGARGFESAAVAPAAAAQKAVMTVEAPRSRPAGEPLGQPQLEKVRDHRGGRDGRWGRNLDCRGYDRGWEEHWGGHGGRGWSPREACDDCRRSHGSCTFRCTTQAWRCSANWVPRNGTQGRSYEGRRPRPDRYDAEDEAMRECRDDNWNNREQGDCRPGSCKEENETVDSGRC